MIKRRNNRVPLLDVPTQPVTEYHSPSQTIPAVTWGPWTAFFYGLFVFLAAQFAAVFIVSVYPRLHGWNKLRREDWLSTVTGQFWFVLIAEILTFGAIWWYVRYRKSSLQTIGFGTQSLRRLSRSVAQAAQRHRLISIIPFLSKQLVPGRTIGYGLIGYGAYFVAYLVIFHLVSTFVPQINVNQQQDIGFQNVLGHLDLWLTFISVVLLPPIVEELVFRGFIYSGMRRKLPFVWAAIFTSLLFAAPHALESSGGGPLWIGAIDTATLSLVLCFLRERSGSLWPGIVTHGIKNATAFYVVFILHVH